jgi:hypothetical protein
MILTVFGGVLAACLAIWVAGLIIIYWKPLLLTTVVMTVVFGLITIGLWQLHEYNVVQENVPSPTPQPKIHQTKPETWLVEK